MRELDKNMYFGAKPDVMDLAKSLRNAMTCHEKLLWEKLKGKQICGVRFRRQHAISFYIVDFYCHDAFLVVSILLRLIMTMEDRQRWKNLVLK